MENPIPPDSFPTLTCTIKFDPAVDDVNALNIRVTWSGPTYMLQEYPVVPTRDNEQPNIYRINYTLNMEERLNSSHYIDYSCSANITFAVKYVQEIQTVCNEELTGEIV